jgi:hypothetical protein
MSNKQGQSGKGGNEQKKRSQFVHTTISNRELVTLKSVLYGYLGFLSHIGEPKALETQARLQAVHDRLPDLLETGGTIYFDHKERVTILDAAVYNSIY